MEKSIYLIYSNTYSKVSKVLNFFMREDYTHISISLEQDLDKFYSFGRRNFYIPLIGGFVEESTGMGIFSYFNETIIEVVEKKVTEEEYSNLREEIDKYKIFSNIYKYNLIGLPLIMLNIPFERERHFACSQFVGYLIQESGIHNFSKSWSLIQPKDLREISDLKIVYKGKMQDFNTRGGATWKDLVTSPKVEARKS